MTMTVNEIIELLKTLPGNAEILVDTPERYAEIKSLDLEFSQRVNERKPFVIVKIYRQGFFEEKEWINVLKGDRQC